ncbi:hypothetical protein THAOC_01686, partial [Thalassiosira oceanica]
CTEAAELGSIQALFDLGDAYNHGEGVQQDVATAVEFYAKAAMQGHVSSRYNLGNHEGRKGNHDRAVRHWLISAKMGHKDSVQNMKRAFMTGVATKEQYAEALKGYQGAVEEMKSHDRDEAKAFLDNRNFGRRWMDKPERSHQLGLQLTRLRQERQARPLRSEAARAVKQDKAKAVEFWTKAAMQGHVLSRSNLGLLEIRKGNYDRAVRHWLISAKMGYERSLEAIKDCFMAGLATKKQYAEALKGYQEARRQTPRAARANPQSSVLARRAVQPIKRAEHHEHKRKGGRGPTVAQPAAAAAAANFDTLPEVEPVDLLGGHDSEGQPKPSPILAIGPVKKRGKDLPSMYNHADYVGSRGYYDLTQFMIDHKRELPSLSNTFLGKLALTQQANPTVKTEFLRRWKGKLFGEDEDRDDVEFWHQEMGIYLDEFPQHEGIFEGIETDESGTGTAES